jgi:hypothetical protein
MSALIALFALASAQAVTPAAQSSDASPPAAAASTAKPDRFADRPRARIAFVNEVRNFQVKRDGHDDVIFLETRRNRWFRSEIQCFGIDDPRDAHGLLPLDRTSGFDDFSRIALVSFSRKTNECRLNRLVELTPEETVEFRLVRQRSAKPPNSPPAS